MAWYRKFINFAPAGEQLTDLAVTVDTCCKIGDMVLKAFVFGAAFYFAIEIAHGFLRHFGGR